MDKVKRIYNRKDFELIIDWDYYYIYPKAFKVLGYRYDKVTSTYKVNKNNIIIMDK